MTDEAAKRLGLKVDYKSTSVTGSLAGLTAGQYDLASSGLGVTEERQKSVDFTKPLFWSTVAVLTTAKSRISSFDGFNGKRVGVVTGSSHDGFTLASVGDLVVDDALAPLLEARSPACWSCFGRRT